MKLFKFAFLLCIASLVGCSAAPKRTSDFCVVLDAATGFARCETTEVVCYGNACWPKPAPSAAPQIAVSKEKATVTTEAPLANKLGSK